MDRPIERIREQIYRLTEKGWHLTAINLGFDVMMAVRADGQLSSDFALYGRDAARPDYTLMGLPLIPSKDLGLDEVEFVDQRGYLQKRISLAPASTGAPDVA